MQLIDLGWNDFFTAHFHEYQKDGLIPARVARENKSNYLLLTESGERVATVTGKLLYEQDENPLPVVGDWVVIIDANNQSAQIQAVLPRKSAFKRNAAGVETKVQIVAANIDTVFIVSGLDDDFNPRRLERYLTSVWDSGATPVLVLNKADICEDITSVIDQLNSIAFGVPVHIVSALSNNNMSVLEQYLSKGQTVALIGSSGVGKSTIINQFLGIDLIKTNEVSDEKSKGRHTTTHREIYPLPNGALLIDTPGMKELQLWADESSLKQSFEDIENLTVHCRFVDCTHLSEPGCAVKKAIELGEIDPARLTSYHKQLRELKFLENRKSELGRHEEKKRGKKFASMVKEVKKLKGRYKRN